MELLGNIIIVVYYSVIGYFAISSGYFLFFAILSHFRGDTAVNSVQPKKLQVKILIPAYKEDQVILETARSAARHISSLSDLETVVIADSLQASTIDKLRAMSNVSVQEVAFEKSTKALSLNAALEQLSTDTDYVLILDADNIMEEGAADELLKMCEAGNRVVQGHRTAKNSNTAFAVLDGISEEINNAIFRQGHRAAGLSASLIGSGFIGEFALLKNLMNEIKAVGGFDKELELAIISRKIKIAYAGNALFYDEKVQNPEAFQNQRRRWISAQILYLKRYFFRALKELFASGNIDLFDKTMQYALPPRIFSLAIPFIALFFHTIEYLIFKDSLQFIIAWITVAGLTVFALTIAVPGKFWNKKLLKSILSLPKGFFLMFLALLKLKGANNSFIHTPHGIENR